METGGKPATLQPGVGRLLGNTASGRFAEMIISTRTGGARRGSPGSGVPDAAGGTNVPVGAVAITRATLRVWRCCNIPPRPTARKSNPKAPYAYADTLFVSRYSDTALHRGMTLISTAIQKGIWTGFFAAKVDA